MSETRDPGSSTTATTSFRINNFDLIVVVATYGYAALSPKRRTLRSSDTAKATVAK